MAVIGAIDMLRPALIIAKVWCEACFSGVHKSCDDHRKAVAGSEYVDDPLTSEV